MGKELSRRDFLKTTAAGAVGAVAMGAMSPFASAKAEEAGERLEIICDTASRDVFETI